MLFVAKESRITLPVTSIFMNSAAHQCHDFSIGRVPVAQVANLPYRQLPVGWVLRLPRRLRFPHAFVGPRHAGWQPAKQQTGSLRYGSERGEPCPRESANNKLRTWLSALLAKAQGALSVRLSLSSVLLILLALSISSSSGAGAERQLHLSPEGNDAWSGKLARPNRDRTDGPLASLDGARLAIRKIKETVRPAPSIRVIVASGTYSLRKPVIFSAEDSGSADAPITFEAARNARPVFTGGRAITG